jgi:tRNA(Ile)-lysidine synthase
MIVEAVRRFIAPCDVVVAVSGGADSTALLVAFRELDEFRVTAAHINHHLRGSESDEDETFVRELCARLEIALDVADGTLDPSEVKRSGIEAAARDVRTRLLLKIKERRGARYVATAHQKNDQAETVLMRLFTGSGIAGLRGIHPIRDDGFIRPLLDVTRADIDAFLRERSITPRFDSSNADPRFLRNRIRMMLRDCDPSPIAAVAQQARTMWQLVERAVDAIEVQATSDQTRFITLPDDEMLRQALLHRHIRRLDPRSRDVSAADLARLARELDAIRRTSVTKSLELIRRDDRLILRRVPEAVGDYEFEIDAGENIFIPTAGATFSVRSIGGHAVRTGEAPVLHGNGQPFQLPRGAKPHFTIRNRRDGDRFRPLGLGHEKKLKDLLIDRKIPVEERDRIPLLIWEGEIVWVAGVEISDSFKITEESDTDRYEAEVHAGPDYARASVDMA